MLKYKIDILQALKDAGYNTTVIRKGNIGKGEKVLGESALTTIRSGKMVGIKSIDMICKALHCQPGDLIEYVEE